MDTSPKPSGLFVAGGEKGLRMISPDGVRWEHIQTGREGEIYQSVCFGKGRFVALATYGGKNLFANSADGQKWEVVEKQCPNDTIRSVTFGKDRFLAVGGTAGFGDYAEPVLIESADGRTWGPFRKFGGKRMLRRLAYGNDRFVGVGDCGRRAVSNDGKEWKDVEKPLAEDTLIDITFGKGIFVGAGMHGLRMSSTDGLKWEHRETGEEGEHINSVLWTGEQFVAVGLGATYFSADGAAWKRQPNRNAPLRATYGAGLFVGSRWKGRILTSKDAIVWEQAFKSEQHVETIAFGG